MVQILIRNIISSYEKLYEGEEDKKKKTEFNIPIAWPSAWYKSPHQISFICISNKMLYIGLLHTYPIHLCTQFYKWLRIIQTLLLPYILRKYNVCFAYFSVLNSIFIFHGAVSFMHNCISDFCVTRKRREREMQCAVYSIAIHFWMRNHAFRHYICKCIICRLQSIAIWLYHKKKCFMA